MAKGTAIFLDTSIQIARLVHSPDIKDKIKKESKNMILVLLV